MSTVYTIPRGEVKRQLLSPVAGTVAEIRHLPLRSIRPSPENGELYKPIDPRDPDIKALAMSVREFGVREPLTVTADGFILSGHRRYAAARLARLRTVPCRVEGFRRLDDRDRFVRLLREYNRQRVKSFDEVVREECVSIDPDAAYKWLQASRVKNPGMPGFGDLDVITLDKCSPRCRISKAKRPMLEAVKRVIEGLRDYWALSIRSVHYRLLPLGILRHSGKPDSTYRNNDACYNDLCDLCARARLTGEIPWQAITDENRPVVLWDNHADVGSFIRRELGGFLCGYTRDYQRTQPDHIEVVCEKLGLRGIVQPIVARYGIPLTIGKGYASVDVRYRMAQRFRASGKNRLIIPMLSDYDPDGEVIAESLARSMRDDFGVASVVGIQVALTERDVERLALPPKLTAKQGSAHYAKFVAKHRTKNVWELDALEPAELQRMLTKAIDTVLNVELFNRELDAERRDSAELQATRNRVLAAMRTGTGSTPPAGEEGEG
jgi:hypothetical protein